MKTSIFLLLLGLCTYGGEAVTHSLKYFYTASTQIPNFPEFVTVGMVDDQEIEHYDSITGKAQVKQEWLAKYIADSDPQYSERNTQIYMGNQPGFKSNIEVAKGRFNQTGGIHLWQLMYGCEWDDETGELKGNYQFGYDGEDFVAFDLETQTWIAPTNQGVITQNKWNNDKAYCVGRKNYLTQLCPEWLKKYVNYGKSSLMRTVRPSVSLLRKSSSSPVSCHATGFYPNKAEMVWRKDGVELHEGVEKGEILPNNDGTFQMSVDMKVAPSDWKGYDCVFQLSGVNTDIVTKLDKAVIKTNEGNFVTMIIAIVAAVALVVIGLIGFMVYKKKKDKRPPSPVENREVQEQMITNEA